MQFDKSKKISMRYCELVEARLRTGVRVSFKKVKLRNGNMAMSLETEDGKKYVLDGSLKNFNRFQSWHGKKATADIKPTFKRVVLDDGSKLKTTKINVTVKSEVSKPSSKNGSSEEVF